MHSVFVTALLNVQIYPAAIVYNVYLFISLFVNFFVCFFLFVCMMFALPCPSKTMQGRSLSREGEELSGEVLHEEEEGGMGNDCESGRKAKTHRVDREAESIEEAAERRFSDNDLR